MKIHFFNSETLDLVKNRFVYRIPAGPDRNPGFRDKDEVPYGQKEQLTQEQRIQELKKIFTISIKNSREVLSKPDQLSKIFGKIDEKSGKHEKVSDKDLGVTLVKKLIDSVKSDTNFLKKVIPVYIKAGEGFRHSKVAVIAIKNINADDAYFKKLFEDTKEVYSYEPKGEVVKRIKDQAYLKKIYLDDQVVMGRYVLEVINDQHLLGQVALNKRVPGEREYAVPLNYYYNQIIAIRRLNNRKILRELFNKYTNLYNQEMKVMNRRSSDLKEIIEIKEEARKRLLKLGEVVK